MVDFLKIVHCVFLSGTENGQRKMENIQHQYQMSKYKSKMALFFQRRLFYLVLLAVGFITFFIFHTEKYKSTVYLQEGDKKNSNMVQKSQEFAEPSSLNLDQLGAKTKENALQFFNQLGKSKISISDFENLWRNDGKKVENPDADWRIRLYHSLKDIGRKIQEKAVKSPNVNRQDPAISSRPPNLKKAITVATVGCGMGLSDAMILLKSVTLFSQDANLHAILFTDRYTIERAGKALMELKWTVNELGWDFSFEIQRDWFPKENHDMWANIWKPCSSQRLFFPSRLPHIDSLIYLDADIIVVSNLTKLWSEFDKMDNGPFCGLAANTEFPALGWYSTLTKTPHYGHGGLNAGVMLMNLTRMRPWGFQEKAVKAYAEYQKDIILADQDILNILFNKTPEKVIQLSCIYNFCGSHCFTEGIKGFCRDLKTEGMTIAHGNAGDFKNNRLPFYYKFFNTFKEFDLLVQPYENLMTSLTNGFNSLLSLNPPPCLTLEPADMYKNGAHFLNRVSGTNFTLDFKMLPKKQ